MKKIIEGRRYDTEKAELVAEYSHLYPNDFHWWSEELYRKRTGEFFLHGEGGPASKYAESCGQNEWRGGEKLIPLTYENAQQWAEKYLDGDEYERIFGEIVEEDDNARITVAVSITPAVQDKLRRLAGQTGKTMSDIICEAITEYEKVRK